MCSCLHFPLVAAEPVCQLLSSIFDAVWSSSIELQPIEPQSILSSLYWHTQLCTALGCTVRWIPVCSATCDLTSFTLCFSQFPPVRGAGPHSATLFMRAGLISQQSCAAAFTALVVYLPRHPSISPAPCHACLCHRSRKFGDPTSLSSHLQLALCLKQKAFFFFSPPPHN